MQNFLMLYTAGGPTHQGRHGTGYAPTQHKERRWPDLKQILETPSDQA
jgi:hypothetical protein